MMDLSFSMAAKIAWAFDQTGAYRYVREVPNGKACNCTCMDCGESLIAYHPNPLTKTSYFAHYSASKCSGESVLHKVAKMMLEDLAATQSTISLPPYFAEIEGTDCLGFSVYSSFDLPVPKWKMQHASSEQPMGALILDSLVSNHASDKLGIEIYVRNKKTSEDKIKFEQLPVEVMELDLSGIEWSISREDLKKQLLTTASRRWLNSVGKKRVNTLVESKLPQLIALRNEEILSEFSCLKEQTISKSFQVDIPITTLTSKEHRLDDNTSFHLEKHVSIRNLRPMNNDLFSTCNDFSADLLVDGKQKNNHSVQVHFALDGKAPKSKSANVLFRLTFDEFANSFNFQPFLRSDAKWREALETLAQIEAVKRSNAIAKEFAEKHQFLNLIKAEPDNRLSQLKERYGALLLAEDTPTEGWGLPDKLWAPLFIEFVLAKFKGKSVEVGQLINENILDNTLNLHQRYKSKAQRASAIRNLLDYLKALQIIGSVEPAPFWLTGKKGTTQFFIPPNISDRANITKLLKHYPRPILNTESIC